MMNETTQERVKFINKEMFEKAGHEVLEDELSKTDKMSGMAAMAIGMQTMAVIEKLKAKLFGEEEEDE